VVAGAAISVGAHAVAGQERQAACDSNRIWKVLGCGGFYLGAWQPGADEFARDGEHCAWYRDRDEAVALAESFLAAPDRRAAIAAAGREHALSDHTYAHRLRLLLQGRGHTMV
jgi:spore maturation protein CgeB